MGYTTHFTGKFVFDRVLDEEHKNYLSRFSETRRMKRNPEKTINYIDPLRAAVKLPLGLDAEFYVGSLDQFGQDHSDDIVDYNDPPGSQPGLWCDWRPDKSGLFLIHNESEKSYEYDRWLDYLIAKFFIPWTYTLNGEVKWQGEDYEDFGLLKIQNNILKKLYGKKVYSENP